MRRMLIGVVALSLAVAGAALAQAAGEAQTVRVCVQVGDEETCRELENVDPRIAARILEFLENPPPILRELRRRLVERFAPGRTGLGDPRAWGRAPHVPQLGGLTLRQLPDGGWMIIVPPQAPLARVAPAPRFAPLPARPEVAPRAPMTEPLRLGVSVVELPERAGQPAGVYIAMVQPGSPAADAGLQGMRPSARRPGEVTGDRIVSLDGRPVTSASEFAQAIASRPAGAVVALEIARGEETVVVSVTLRGAPTAD